MIARFAVGLLVVGLQLGVTSACAADGDDDHPGREAMESRVRSGLSNLLAKLNAGGDQEVAYLGGGNVAAVHPDVIRSPAARLAEQ